MTSSQAKMVARLQQKIVYTQGDSPLHIAARNGNRDAFYALLAYYKSNLPTNPNDLLSNSVGETPWHIAARCGHVTFFEKPDNQYDEFWESFINNYVNKKDSSGNTLLHAAVLYQENMSATIRKNKKKIMRYLLDEFELDINEVNDKKQTALHSAAEEGCYETCYWLLQQENINLTLLDNSGKTAANLAASHDHERIRNMLLMHTKPYQAGKNVSLDMLNQSAGTCLHLHESFVADIKNAKDDVTSVDIKQVINIRTQALHKKNRRNNIARAMSLAICPAVAAAGLVGLIGSFIPIPFAGVILALATFPIFYAAYSFFTYKSLSSEHDKRLQETFYLQWVGVKLQELEQERLEIKRKLNSSSPNLVALNAELATLEMKAKTYYDFQNTKHPKLKLSTLSQDHIKEIKSTVANDPKDAKKYADRKGWGIPAANYFVEAFCSVGGIGELFGYATTMGKVALIGGLVGSLLIPLVGVVVGGVVVGGILYKATYQREKEKAGEKNRDLLMAHDACKNAFNVKALQGMKIQVSAIPTPVPAPTPAPAQPLPTLQPPTPTPAPEQPVSPSSSTLPKPPNTELESSSLQACFRWATGN